MFHFFRKAPEPKKAPIAEREAHGFVLVGDTANEKRGASEGSPPEEAQRPSQADAAEKRRGSESEPLEGPEGQPVDSGGLVSELLKDVPFTLAPHILAVQDSVSDLPSHLLTLDVNEFLSRFWYDFTLENSLFCDP